MTVAAHLASQPRSLSLPARAPEHKSADLVTSEDPLRHAASTPNPQHASDRKRLVFVRWPRHDLRAVGLRANASDLPAT